LTEEGVWASYPAMSLFEFVLTLYSIIMGLGLTLLIRSVGQMLEARRKTRTYWVHSGWLVALMLTYIVFWLQLWLYRDVLEWSAGEVMLVLMVPVLLYLVSHLSVPELEDGLEHDMREYYYAHHRLVQGLLFAAILLAGLSQRFILDRWHFATRDLMRGAVLALLLPGILSKRHAAQVLAVNAAILIAALEALQPLHE
jgi:uncharacterized BrkB/YihY/UPF0761 family membrane protein